VDGVTIARFKANLDSELEALAEDLATSRYRCRPLRRIFIPKPDGERRPLGVACIRDRVVQTACLMLLEPIFESTFSHASFGFRPRRNAHQALAMARSLIGTGRTWAVTADIEKCFDRIDHEVLLDLVGRRVSDPLLLARVRHWLTVDVLEFRDFVPAELGVPQGDPLSPLLATIYLDPLDKHFEGRGIDFVRYADDVLIFTLGETEALRALQVLGDYLHDPLHLTLKPAKTNHVPVDAGVDFLGFRLTTRTVQAQPGKLDRVLASLRELLRVLGAVESTLLQQAQALSHVNALVRGFRNYFALPEISCSKHAFALLACRLHYDISYAHCWAAP
jgi:RNA-directed DNA polymerase